MGKRLWLSIAAIVIAVAAGIYYYRSDVAAETPTLSTAEVSRGDVIATVEATGTLEAVTTVEVGTQVSGTIKTLGADFNSQVRRGQVIAELDPSLFDTQVAQERATVARLKAEVDRARVQAEDAKVKLGRAQDLAKQELIAKSDLDAAVSTSNAAEASVKSAEAQLVQAQASLNQAQVNLSHTVIRAPIDGVVIARNVNVGQTVAASMQAPTLFVLAQNLKEMNVKASVDESDIGKIQLHQPVRFRVDAYPNETFTGTVSQVRLQPVVEQNVVSYITMIEVPNADLKLKPGMTAAVTIETGRAEDAIKVPNAALRFRPTAEAFQALGQKPPEPRQRAQGEFARGTQAGTNARGPQAGTDGQGQRRDRNAGNGQRNAVWVLADNNLKRVPVQVGITDGTQTVVMNSDLTAGTRVVTGVTTPSTPTAAAPAGSPLIPQGRRFGGGGGGGGNNAGGRR
ncbi:MAG TPA: efflux RND transporter periplasmic adaptor subunit [Vicinamibacterales bacterium]